MEMMTTDDKRRSLHLPSSAGRLGRRMAETCRSSSLNDLYAFDIDNPELEFSILSHSDSSRCDSLEMNQDSGKPRLNRDRHVETSDSTVDSLEQGVENDHKTSPNISNASDLGTTDSLETEDAQHSVSSLTSDGRPAGSNLNVNKRPGTVPRSKTFDSASGKSAPRPKDIGVDNFDKSAASATRSITPNRAHVFLTSNECMVVPGTRLPKENKSSKLRFEKQHSAHDCGPEVYLTPMQRKDNLIKGLKKEIQQLNTRLEEKDREISLYKQTIDSETSVLVAGKDEEIAALREAVRTLKESNEDLNSFCEESLSAAAALETRVNDLKEAMTEREQQQERLYLEMYRKGQDTARFERAEELEELAVSGGCKVTISELVKKLAWTELELAKWQTLRREEIYHDAARPETEADATFRFLRDSFFHFLTDARDADQHLRAMIRICRFTEPQMKKIESGKILEILKKSRTKRR